MVHHGLLRGREFEEAKYIQQIEQFQFPRSRAGPRLKVGKTERS
jgi:hypothetical protein